MKKLIAVVAITVLTGLVVAGAVSAGAQEAPTTTAAPATEPGSGHARPCPGVLGKALDKLVGKGVLTQEQADAVRTAVREELPAGGTPGHPDRWAMIQRAFAVAADAIGVEVSDLHHAVMDGGSVAEVAEAHGVDPQTVVDALIEAGTKAIDEAASSGKLGEEAAARAKARLPEAADRFVHFTRPSGG